MNTADIKKDAKGQFAPSQADAKNNGLDSAAPRVLTGNEDATLENADQKQAPKPGFEIRDRKRD
jgi:hypothetical protein